MRWLIALLSILALIIFLKWQFPYAVQSQAEQMNLLYMVGLLALVGSGLIHGRNIPGKEVIRTFGIWLGILLLLVLAYSYRDVFLNNRIMAELMPHRAQVSGDGVITVRSGEDGHFHIEISVNDVPVKFMVDTGASDIVLSPRDAKRVGFNVSALHYSRTYATANGAVKGAPVRLNVMQVGSITMRNVPASVNSAMMGQSLLGMGFLKSLTSYSVEGNTLRLVP